ncbi:glycosyltransferase WbuB [Polynucleobacter necessarius]|uniref:glycosyltransferase WbuB n=1 Tax=Polynucleobacter necessarius TaxID=576610 RepID=UPI0022B25C73|nr:glycosyltransferase WbuB [Polynucleobacter necessarius]
MRILLYSVNFFPEIVGIGKYSGEMAFWLAEAGHDVKVVAAPPYYPKWKIHNGFSGFWYQKELHKRISPKGESSISIYRCPIWVPLKPTGFKRIIHLASFALSSMPIMIMQAFWRPNIVMVIEPPLFCAPTALFTSILCNSKSWIHIQDFEVDAAFDLGLLRNTLLRRVILFAERILLRSFDRVSTISKSMLNKLGQKGIRHNKIRSFPNWINVDEIHPLRYPNFFRASLKIPNETCIALYSGNLGEKQGLDVVIDAARIIKSEIKILFVICGEGVARESLIKYAKDAKNILWLPLQPSEIFNELLNFADVHLLPQRKGLGELMMPSKLLGMQASGRPIIAMVEQNTELKAAVSKCGIVVNPGDFEGLAEALKYLAENPDKRLKMGLAARKQSMNYSKNKILSNFEEELKLINNTLIKYLDKDKDLR